MPRTLSVAVLAAALAATAGAAKLRVPKQHATIQAAIDAAAPGDVVEISKGTYLEELSISKTDLVVRAKKGHLVVVDAGGDGRPLGVVFSVGVTVKNLRFRNTADDIGVGVALSSDVVLKGCRVEDVPNGHGIEVGAATVTLVKCRVNDVGGDGLHVGTNDAVIRGCTIRDVGGHGVAIVGARALVEENTIETVGGAGIAIGDGTTGAADALVRENQVEGAGAAGIRVDADATAATLRKNSSRKNGGAGVEVVAGATGGLYAKNVAKKGVADGFLVAGVGNTFDRNVAKKNAGFDLNDATSPGDNVYTDNIFGTTN